MSPTQYVSPIILAGLSADATPDAKAIKFAKQRLMAEFELTDTSTISFTGNELTRNDVLILFARLENVGLLQYDLIVAADKVLLHFLTRHEILSGQKFSTEKERLTPDFIRWLSPFFCHAFYLSTSRIYTKVSEIECRALFANPWLMTRTDHWQAWRGAEARITLMLENLKHINTTTIVSPAHIDIYTDKKFIRIMSVLPEDRFGELMNNYAFELMQLAIKEFNNRHYDYAINIMVMARSLRVKEELMTTLLAKEQEMESLLGTNVHTEKPWLITRIVIAVFILTIIATALSC